MNIEIPERFADAVYLGLGMIANLRETGDARLSLEDARKRGLKVRAPSAEQLESAKGIRKIMHSILNYEYPP